MACSDGSVKVLSIPNIKELKESFGVEDPSLPLWVKPEGVSACLLPGGGDLLAVDDVFGSCLCFDWCAADRHEKIIAGFSSGVLLGINVSSFQLTFFVPLSRQCCGLVLILGLSTSGGPQDKGSKIDNVPNHPYYLLQ